MTISDHQAIEALAYDPACPFRHDVGHVCLRRDGRSVGTLGGAGDCYEGARAEMYGYYDIDAARELHPSFEPDVDYLLQQSLIDAADAETEAARIERDDRLQRIQDETELPR